MEAKGLVFGGGSATSLMAWRAVWLNQPEGESVRTLAERGDFRKAPYSVSMARREAFMSGRRKAEIPAGVAIGQSYLGGEVSLGGDVGEKGGGGKRRENYQEGVEWEADEPHLAFGVEQPDGSLGELLVKGEQHLLPVTKLGPARGIGVVRRGDGDLFEHEGEKHADVGVLLDQVPELPD